MVVYNSEENQFSSASSDCSSAGPCNLNHETLASLIESIHLHSSYGSISETDAAQTKEASNIASEESKHWMSTEDDEFVTPWYTHVVRVLMVPAGLMILYYVYWRIVNFKSSISIYYDIFAWVFILCECFCFIFTMNQWMWMWNLKYRKRITQSELNLTDKELPTIDILIPCYTEPPELVHMTLNSCYDLDYPADKITIYICDDGSSDLMKEMVEEASFRYRGDMRTRYIARRKIPGVPHHAKAGNLNHCILNGNSTSTLILVLDCDMLPEPRLARTVVPFFFKKSNGDDLEFGAFKAIIDEQVGMVQTPQAFYNLDEDDLLGQSYSYFYEIVISGWDASGGTPCCGTGVMFSRQALESIGGFSYGSITEDFKTSMNLSATGYKCKYFLQYMTRGVSPKELNTFMMQRLRWSVGAYQIFRRQNPLFVKGLPFKVRWLYFFSTIGTIYMIPMAFMLIVMYGTILSGYPINFGPKSFAEYILLAGVAIILLIIIQYLIAWRLSFSDFIRILQENFTVAGVIYRAMLIGLFDIDVGFTCTIKDVSFNLKENMKHAAPHLILYAITAVAMVKAAFELLEDKGYIKLFWSSEYQPFLLITPIFWTFVLWILISGPPRMIIYGYLRSRREAKKRFKNLNKNVPINQELPNSPVNIFPPLSAEIWSKDVSSMQLHHDKTSSTLDSSESSASNHHLDWDSPHNNCILQSSDLKIESNQLLRKRGQKV